MTPTTIFQLEAGMIMILSILVSKWYVWPKIKTLNVYSALIPLLFVSATRVLGLGLLDPHITLNIPVAAHSISYGDAVSGLIALLALILVHAKKSIGIGLTWLYAVVGSLDILVGLYKIQAYNLGEVFGPFSLTAVLVVPPIIVSMVLVWMVLIKNPKTA